LYITFLTVLLNLLLGLFVYLKNPQGATHRYFFLLTIVISSWSLANHYSLHSDDEETTLFWIRVVMAITSFLMPTVFLLANAFPRAVASLSERKTNLVLGVAVLSAVLALTPYMFTDVRIEGGEIMPTPGPFIIFYGLQFFLFLMSAIVTLVRKYRVAIGLEKLQMRYLLFGSFITFTLIAITNVVFVLWLETSAFVLFGPFFTLFFVAMIAYAIVKHRFLDINLVVAKSVAYFLLLSVLATTYSVFLFTLQRIFLRQLTASEQIVMSVLISLVIIFSFQPIKNWLDRTTNKIFFRRGYNPSLVLEEIGQLATGTLNLQNLTDGILEILNSKMSLKGSALLLLMKEHGFYLRVRGGLNQQRSKMELHNSKFFNAFRLALRKQREGILIYDELPESEVKKMFRRLGINVVAPLIVRRRLVGILILQAKNSEIAFTTEDIKVIKLLVPQLAVMVNNALAFSEIKHFNTVLEEEIERATQELKKANRELKELDKLKDEFVSIASHELRTPLTAIKSYLWMALAGKGGKLGTKLQHYLNRSYSSTNRLIKLVNDMLNVSQIESGRMILNRQAIDLKAVIKDVVEEVKPRSKELGVELEIITLRSKGKAGLKAGGKIDPKLNGQADRSLRVLADKDKLQEILLNLIGNSLKFTPKGGKISVVIEPRSSGMYQVTIRDTGVGMSEDTIGSLFQKFGLMAGSYQTNKQAKYGTGLGLYISKSLVELHGGKIWAESSGNGKGSQFHFTLPAARKSSSQA
jgi:signal transduction histidine kinase